MTAHRCRFCRHLPHPDGRCGVKSVTGPAVNTNAGSGYCPEEHTGRTVTRCGCTDYLPTLNGVSGCTVDGIENAIRAYLAEHYSDTTVLTDWFVAYGAMRSTDESPTGLGYVTGYTCSDSSPQGTLGIAQLGVNHMSDDLAGGRDD